MAIPSEVREQLALKFEVLRIKEIRRLLQEHCIGITPTTLCFSNGQEIKDFVRTRAPVTERLLVAVLYERKIGTRPVLADAFGITLSTLNTLNNALADAQPLLCEAGITLPPAPARFSTGAELLASVGHPPADRAASSNTPTS
jgi:hypothetical protein